MKALGGLVAVGAIAAAVFLMRIVLHGYTHHQYFDGFHFGVALAAVSIGLLVMRQTVRRRT